MNRKITFSVDEHYHIYNRGTDKRQIFLDHDDYDRFVKLLYLCNGTESIVFRDIPIGETYGFDRGETLVDIGAYCLMPNHFHLLLREKNEGGISLFMKKLSTGYSMYFNLKKQENRQNCPKGRIKRLMLIVMNICTIYLLTFTLIRLN